MRYAVVIEKADGNYSAYVPDLADCCLTILRITCWPGGADRDDHDAIRPELLKERRRDVVDAAGDDDLVEGRKLLPAVIAVRVLAGDRLVFGIAALDQDVVDAAG